MLITTTVTKQEEVTQEINLPYYSKYCGTYYRINEDESVLSVFPDSLNQRYVSMDLAAKNTVSRMADALKGELISEEDFLAALQRTVNRMDTILSSLSKTEAI
jgi:hypothetical protein